MTLPIIQKYFTENDCYKSGKKITPTGIMWHSTAVREGESANTDFYYSRWNKSGLNVCVHAFLDETNVLEALPIQKGNCWKAWHCGSSTNGSMNNTHVSFEIIEPKDYKDKAYFEKIYENAIQYTVILCQRFGIDTITEKNLLCHAEAHVKYKMASNHADVDHWFKYHNKTMSDVRKEVQKRLDQLNEATASTLPKQISPKVKSEWVSKLQKECNAQGLSNQKVDGYSGKNTLAGCPLLKKGSKGNIVKLLQEQLVAIGYDVNGVDGLYGTGCVAGVKKFQSDNGLIPDGYFGQKSWGKLLGLS